ncbi:hypothetical protein C9374_011626 [Naegleria lovaniensis]|uniref:Uncharacterized protein n=1 Tax=Naegleria lovaniensis TaxID=51637 RepID=A0AA88GCH5_NAELO|nr:uncharacterized protein C9374_011626 [Naegleria lovaniensis]KAG2373961.1 hypothetical protein C9374_011626 [Naegleria lovaniensis]
MSNQDNTVVVGHEPSSSSSSLAQHVIGDHHHEASSSNPIHTPPPPSATTVNIPISSLRKRKSQTSQFSPSFLIEHNDDEGMNYEVAESGAADHHSTVLVEPATNPIDSHKNVGNHLFGFKPWKGMLGERRLEERSEQVKQLYMWNSKSNLHQVQKSRFLSVGNVLYGLLIGWWMFLIYMLVGVLSCVLIVTIPYGKKCFSFAFYYLYPFGKYIEVMKNYRKIYHTDHSYPIPEEEGEQQSMVQVSVDVENSTTDITNKDANNYYSTFEQNGQDESIQQHLLTSQSQPSTTTATNTTKSRKKKRDVTCLGVLSFSIWIIFLAPILTVFHAICMVMTWFSIVGIPSSKIHMEAIKILFRNILVLNVNDEYPPHVSSEIILCTFQASNIYYYKHSVFGLNVILFNMLPFSAVSIILGFAFGEEFVKHYSLVIFPFCLISTVPLAYLIGKAVAAISAQTNFLIGAVLNAFCGSIIELILYILALWKDMHDVVVTAVTGALLAATLLVPGLAMVIGGIKFKQQFFNRQAASVSSALLLISVVASLLPSLFYQMFSTHYELKCGACVNAAVNQTQLLATSKLPIVTSVNGTPISNGTYGLVCEGCSYVEKDPMQDAVYTGRALPLAYAVAGILPVAYLIGLIFSLKTHRFLIERPPVPENKEDLVHHEEENEIGAVWPIWFCVVVLVVSTIIYSLVAEVMTSSLEPAFDFLHINPMFAGLTFLSIVPSCAEFVNAIQFALQNNISLALEIGNTASIQIALIQMPVLVVVSAILFGSNESRVFNLMFPQLNLVAIFFSILVLNYVCLDGKTNYFQGSALVIVYILLVVTFFFAYF